MTDIQRALLGDHAAAERLTERGELIPCPFCGGNAVAAGCGVYRHIRCSGCYCDGPQEEGIEAARLSWNTRAPILSAEEMEMLEKIGDTIYKLFLGCSIKLKVERIVRWSNGCWKVNAHTDRKYTDWKGFEIDFSDFGKTVFLTREAAEAALQKGAY